MKKILSLILVLALCLALCACGAGKDKAETTTQTDAGTTPALEPEIILDTSESASETTTSETPAYEGISITNYDDIDAIYTFQINGKQHRLPCTVSEFLDNGDTISENTLNTTIPAEHSMGQIRVHPDGKEDAYIELTVLNDTENAMTVLECNQVIGITLREDSNVSFLLSSGIDLMAETTTLEDIQKYYGTVSPIYSESSGVYTWRFYKKINSDYDGSIVFGTLPGMDIFTISQNHIRLEYAGRP